MDSRSSYGLWLVVVAALLPLSQAVYIPPGPRYRCPTNKVLIYPCNCTAAGDDGIRVRCENTNLATVSVGLANLGAMRIPIEELIISKCNIGRLYGSLFHTLRVRVLRVVDTPLLGIEPYTFLGINRTLNELHIINTKLQSFPAEAFQLLGNLTTLRLDGHEISALPGNIFADSLVPGRLEKLHITNGLIPSLPPEALVSLRKLKKLDLHGNQLKELKRSQFKGLRDTELLDLSHNLLAKIDSSHLADLTKLAWCNISHNLLSDLPRGTFARNTVLRVLNLSHNKLRRLDSNSFRGMRFIRRLYFSDNEISDVGRGTFGSVNRIGTIDLARNQIKKIDYQMFHQLQFVEMIDVSENKVTVIQKLAFKDLFLVKINLSHNAISKIEAGAFENCANITLLDLSHNELKDIPQTAVDSTTYPTELRLSFNMLTSLGQVPMGNMTGLKILNVSHNSLETIPRSTFPKLYELHTIDLSHNKIHDIWNSVFQSLFSLRSLDLSFNALESIKSSTFGSLHTLVELDLSSNQISSLNKGALARLASLRILKLRNNSISEFFQLPISLSSLDLGDNVIDHIVPLETFPSMNSLLRLDLSNNQLGDTLEKGSFAHLLTLQRVDLSGNGLTRPPREALEDLATMQYIVLKSNNLTYLPRGAFGRLPVVFEVNLAHNNINNISARAFEGLLQLLTLNLTHNNLTSIPNGAFQGLVSLRTLDLSHNQLEKLDNKTHGLLDDCLSLERVNLSHNKISFVTRKTFPSNPWVPYRLQEIDLSYNTMPVLTYDITIGTKKVQTLNVSHNSINEVRNHVLGNMSALRVLDMSHNDLTNFTARSFGPPPNLTSLYLSDNKFQTLPMKELKMLKPLLRFLDIRNNQMPEFDPFIMTLVENGSQVLYSGNPLQCDCRLRPLRRWLANQLSPPEEWGNMTCSSPGYLSGQYLEKVSEDMMTCAEPALDDPNYETTPDIKFRDLKSDKGGDLTVTWYVTTKEDVGDFAITLRDAPIDKSAENKAYTEPLLEVDVPYTARSHKIPKLPQSSVPIQLCVLAKNSVGDVRQWMQSQCKLLPATAQGVTYYNTPSSGSGASSVSLVLSLVSLLTYWCL